MYTNIPVNRSGLLRVSPIHEIYWEESGNPNGKPVIFLHGGPGGGTSPASRGFFNPSFYRIIQIDQRACGQSLPHACVEDNTTWDLVADIEKVRDMLGIDQWMVFGGSWGSTLSLVYAQAYPQHVSELILRGIYLCRQSEIDWLYEGGAANVFPEAWDAFYDFIPSHLQDNMVKAYHHYLFDESVSEANRLEAARRWSVWEANVSYLHKNDAAINENDDGHFALAFARIENHYFYHSAWLDEQTAILQNIDKIRHIPTIAIQGRYDMCTPYISAWDLKKAFPEMDLREVLAGHSAMDPMMSAALVAATDEWAKR
jgi:proline iminopeptidase